MNLDLSRALDDLAGSAAAQGDLGPVERIVARRRRRRAARRAGAGAASLAVAGGLVLAGAAVADLRAPDDQPAGTGPAPAASPSPTRSSTPSTGTGLPGCGEPVPAPAATATQALGVTGAARDPSTDAIRATLTLTGASAAGLQTAEVRLYVPYGGDYVLELVDLPPGGWTDTSDGASLDVTGTAEGCPGIEPLGGTLVAAVRTPDGVVVSGPVPLVVE